jgi:hypothetical protein
MFDTVLSDRQCDQKSWGSRTRHADDKASSRVQFKGLERPKKEMSMNNKKKQANAEGNDKTKGQLHVQIIFSTPESWVFKRRPDLFIIIYQLWLSASSRFENTAGI